MMGMQLGGANRGTYTEMNVVPLIDILLVLLVIFL
jgi:biopolymer transport protein ExbD